MIKKQLIMEKAIELFAKQGFKATSVQQITEHCGISKGAFYLSFKSKDELILALIDHFMIKFTSDIDYLVNNTKDDSKLLYTFYYAMYQSFQKHSDFAKIFIKEQTQSFNEEFIIKIRYYDQKLEELILSMIQRLYGEEIGQTKYDLTYIMKGFIKSYSELFLFYNLPLDLDLLARSLVEKTDLLAKHTTIPFISNELIEMFQQTKDNEGLEDQLLEVLDQTVEKLNESIEKESLVLLKQQIIEPTLSAAMIKGLLKNIENDPSCKKASYLLRSFFESKIDQA
ncbi:TetR/AcrR family transcriptional regulator [Bacillus sp. FJAT-50079]|uniref:TetR/AcrR family transcriptional regulator n=1 Tax=Bacillus sp. FJAT-50079 TaxID=2833577 RepID=UPI001BC8F83A|nr:TetR/AcrR family transcriptional regulator [Bacillus sp. FJAT-50079]MBS4207367.1 TetR/AcrR family transcriptional regulator [Bacillus sp. FJAT-50079]